MAVVLNFHGLGSNASVQQFYSDLPAKADAAGFIVVAPQALGDPASFNFHLVVPEPDDVGFTNDLLDELESQFCIEMARVFSTGMSNGAQMSTRLGCSASERIAAIAPVAGWYFLPAIVELSNEPPCSSTRPVPVIAFHGTADTVIPFDGGPGIFDLTFRDIDDEVMPEWAAHNGCADAPTEQVAMGVRLVRYESCDQGATVELHVIEDVDLKTPGDQGGGHTWPGASFEIGPTTQEISATDLMWEFFQTHPMPAAVGGIAKFPDTSATRLDAPGSTGGNSGVLAGIIAGIATAAFALGGAALWVRRRL